MKGLILAGGHGTRLWPITYTKAKQLIPVANKPILFYCIEDMKAAGISDIAIIVGHTPERIKSVKDAVGDGSRWGINVTYIEQDAPRGIAHAVLLSKGFMGNDPFVLYLGDNMLKGGIKEFVLTFKNSPAEAAIMLTEVDDPSRYGIAGVMEGKVIKLVEKPKPSEAPSNLGIVGIYAFRHSIFDVIANLKPSWRNELEITDALQQLIERNCSVDASMVKGWWKDTGKPEDILEANRLVLEELTGEIRGLVEEHAFVNGRVSIGKNTIVRAGARIRGPAIIGDNCEIGPNARIGPYTAIGDGCKIDRTEVEFSVLLPNCCISCDKIISDSLIGANTKIGSREGASPKCGFVLGENSSLFI
jgi:glucose-1-phosphate thymidylyltransferase